MSNHVMRLRSRSSNQRHGEINDLADSGHLLEPPFVHHVQCLLSRTNMLGWSTAIISTLWCLLGT